MVASTIVSALLVVSLSGSAQGYPEWLTDIPGGINVREGGNLGHALGGTEEDNFAEDWERAGKQFTTALCNKDSDGDGVSNGMELGVEDCSQPTTVTRTTNIGNPGNPDVVPGAGGDAPPPAPAPAPGSGSGPAPAPPVSSPGDAPPSTGPVPSPTTPAEAAAPGGGDSSPAFYESPVVIGVGAAALGAAGMALYVRQRASDTERALAHAGHVAPVVSFPPADSKRQPGNIL